MTNSNYLGKAQGYRVLGLTEDQVKVAFLREGLEEDYADELVKVAFFGAIGAVGRGIGAAAKAVKGMGALKALGHGTQMATKALGRGAGEAARWGAHGKRFGGPLGRMQGKAGLLAGRTMKGMQSGITGMKRGVQTFSAAPGATAWSGAKNFGKGFMFMPSATGTAGTLGRAASVGSMVAPMLGPTPNQIPMSGGY